MEIQELISRGRLLFHGAPKRLEVFRYVNGKRDAKDIAKKVGKSFVTTLNDLQKIRNMDLIRPRQDAKGNIVKKDRSTLYEKVPLLRHISISYFEDPIKAKKKFGKPVKKQVNSRQLKGISVPSEQQILEICKDGEDQLYEFKAVGVDTRKITKEICAFANTKMGGLIFYGVDDDGTIEGSDKRRHELDQSLYNSIRSNIAPTLIVNIKERDVVGHKILLIIIPPWNKKDVYQFDGRILIRKGTNVFFATPEECKKLHAGIYVV